MDFFQAQEQARTKAAVPASDDEHGAQRRQQRPPARIGQQVVVGEAREEHAAQVEREFSLALHATDDDDDELTPSSPASGATIGDGMYRTKTGSSIVAVIRDGKSIPAPGPEFGLLAGDVVVAVGTVEGLAAMRELIRS